MLLQGGPHDGKAFVFHAPLPRVIVMVCTKNGFVYSDYRRTRSRGSTYVFVWVEP